MEGEKLILLHFWFESSCLIASIAVFCKTFKPKYRYTKYIRIVLRNRTVLVLAISYVLEWGKIHNLDSRSLFCFMVFWCLLNAPPTDAVAVKVPLGVIDGSLLSIPNSQTVFLQYSKCTRFPHFMAKMTRKFLLQISRRITLNFAAQIQLVVDSDIYGT